MPSPVITEYEESVAFYYEIGLAITAWANVERSLLWIVTACFTKHNYTQAALQFLSIENFRSKLAAAEHLFSTKFDGTKHAADWESLFSDLDGYRACEIVSCTTTLWDTPPVGPDGATPSFLPFQKGPSSNQTSPSRHQDPCSYGILFTRAISSMRSLTGLNFWFAA
jgi:hypothetical protein